MPNADAPSQHLHELFLPYTPDELRKHFVDSDIEGEDRDRHLRRWQERIATAPQKDASFLHRDETLWTAGALLAIEHGEDPQRSWRALLTSLFGAVPPTPERLEWDDLLGPELRLFFEVGLPSPPAYRDWLSRHLDERHALPTRRATAGERGAALEGRTQLDALLLNPTTGFALHIEAKVLSDVDTKTTHDDLRNQLARNLDCLAAPPATHPLLGTRRPDRSFLAMLTPDLFRRHWHSRLYGHLVREYAADPTAIQRDLPHLGGLECTSLSRRIAWLTFEDVRVVEPEACPWLAPSGSTGAP